MASCFLRDQGGAVTVEWVVLVSAAAGVALATAGALSDNMNTITPEVAGQVTESGVIMSESSAHASWRDSMQRYVPADLESYEMLYNTYGALTAKELDQAAVRMNTLVAAMGPVIEDPRQEGLINDMQFALHRAYADRGTWAPSQSMRDPQLEEELINRTMTWDELLHAATSAF